MRISSLILSGIYLIYAFISFAGGLSEAHNLSLKSDDELLSVLNETNSSRSLAAINLLSMRYREPGTLIIHSKYPPQKPYPIQKPIPDTVIQSFFAVAMSHRDIDIRLAAIDGMRRFLARTNILPFFDRLLDSTNSLVKIRVAEFLTELPAKRGMLPEEHLLTALGQCLAVTENEVILKALKCISRIGSPAQCVAPQLEALATHESRHVRSEARKALRSVRKRSR